MSKVPMTKRGHALLQKEVKKLKGVDRPAVIKAIAEARAHGDLKENAEYHAAKEQQGFIEARIKDIEGKLSHVQVIDVTEIDARGKIIFGSTVVILDENTDQEITYKIVGEDEANIKEGMISFTSPIARALIGKNDLRRTESSLRRIRVSEQECGCAFPVSS
jgi:transcription elongation factor GreA